MRNLELTNQLRPNGEGLHTRGRYRTENEGRGCCKTSSMRNLELPTGSPPVANKPEVTQPASPNEKDCTHEGVPTENEGRGCCKTNSMRNLELPTGSPPVQQSLKLQPASPNGEGLQHTRAYQTENEGRWVL
ncbi:unnamed protein product [Rhizophagus irregularis]|nr:unnamed protein product [Rhizophagus irregularis]